MSNFNQIHFGAVVCIVVDPHKGKTDVKTAKGWIHDVNASLRGFKLVRTDEYGCLWYYPDEKESR